MTDAPRAQSDDYKELRGQAEWSLAIDHEPSALALSRSILAALDELAASRAENAKLTAELAMATDAANKGDRARVNAGAMADEIAECRAENAALAKLADELSVDHRDDDTFDAGVRYALFILGFEKEAVEANDASKALRAGQQKGER